MNHKILADPRWVYSRMIPLIFSAVAVAGFSFSAHAASYTVDPDHSHVGFSVRHLVSHVPGEFKHYSCDFSFDPKMPESAKATCTIATKSIATGNDKRDNHLRSPDFFDVVKYPSITFESTGMTADGTDKYKLTGQMRMHGVTKPVVFELEYGGTTKDPSGNNKVGFTASTRVNRKDFGIVWNKTLDAGGAVLGDDVDIKLDIEATEKLAARPERSD